MHIYLYIGISKWFEWGNSKTSGCSIPQTPTCNVCRFGKWWVTSYECRPTCTTRNSNSPNWCKCGLCVAMPTQVENKCCTQSVRECITRNPLFHQIVLDGNILDVAMRYREDILAMEHPRNNENFRHAAYIDNLSFGNMGDLDKETEEMSQVSV